MAVLNKEYSISELDRTFNIYERISGSDPLSKSQKTEQVYLRALLYKILIDFHCINTRQVADYFSYKGKVINRVSVLHAVRKINIYYKNFYDFRYVYNIYFDDKLEEFKEIEEKKQFNISKAKSIREKKESRIESIGDSKESRSKDNDDLDKLIYSLPFDKRKEIFELVGLRVKSWSWKSKDSCEIIEVGCVKVY